MNLVLVKGVATNLYAATGIAAGTQIRVQNQSEQLVTLADSSAGLARDATGDCLTVRPFESATNAASATGAWAKAETGNCLINVRA
ncbi:MAG: hypothetical protein ACRC9H_06680, partial [Aeromonas veronii]